MSISKETKRKFCLQLKNENAEFRLQSVQLFLEKGQKKVIIFMLTKVEIMPFFLSSSHKDTAVVGPIVDLTYILRPQPVPY